MTTPADHSTAVTPEAARAYLINVASTLEHAVLPGLEGVAGSRARDCVTILGRLAARLTAPNEGANAGLQKLAGLASLSSRDATEAEGSVLDTEERAAASVRRSIAETAGGGQRSFDRDQLERYLRSHPLGGEAARIVDAQPLAGGRSKQTVLLKQQGAARLPERFVLRQDWASSVVGTSVTPEFEVLKRVHAAGVRVPEPILLEASADALGSPFLLVGRIDGHTEGDVFDPPASEPLALEVAEQLGRLHAMGDTPFDGLPGIADRSYGAAQLSAELDSFRATIDPLGERNATIATALDWVSRHVDAIDGPRVLVHGDLGFHNFLVHDGHLGALLDWELAHLGHPAEDLGYVQGWVRKMMPWDRFLAAYHAAGGPRSTQLSIDFYTLWASLRLYHMLLQARAAIVSGALRDCEITLCSVHYIPLLLHRTSVALREILARG